jgi:hypothetical protein
MTWLDALGWAGSALLVYSLLQARVLRFRVLNTVGCVVLIVFNTLLGVWPMVGMNLVLAGINLWFIRKLLRDRHDLSAYDVLEVGLTDAYLRHFLRVHADDIRRFFPEQAWAQPADGRSAFLVERGDETVGVVIVCDAGDFTPGEFVYRRSGLFRDRGFTRVVAPTGMVAPYYDSVGFRREGDRRVLDVSQA